MPLKKDSSRFILMNPMNIEKKKQEGNQNIDIDSPREFVADKDKIVKEGKVIEMGKMIGIK